MNGLIVDLKLAARRLFATPLFLLFASSSLALGVGATTAVHAALHELFWKPLGIRDSAEVVVVTRPIAGGERAWAVVSRGDVDELRASLTSIESFAASAPDTRHLVSDRGGRVVDLEAVSGDYFRTLGVGAARGRVLLPDDDRLAAPVAVLSHSTWRTHFHGDPNIVGRPVRLGNQTFEIVGVAAEPFDGMFARYIQVRTALWIPLRTADDAVGPGAARPGRSVFVAGRLTSGSTPARASAEIGALAGGLDKVDPSRGGVAAPGQRQAHPIDRPALSGADRMAWLLFGLVALLLVVACLNLAILMRARGMLRQYDSAVRHALGASRWRLVRELAVEGAIIAIAGGILAIAVARGLLALLILELPTVGQTVSIQPTLGGPALGAAAAALAVSLLMFGIEPAIQLARGVRSADLAGGPGRIGAHRSTRERILLRWQVAISVCFFLVAAVLGRVLVTEARHDPGIDLDRLAVVQVPFWQLGWNEAHAWRVIDDTLARVRLDPQIEAVAASAGLPFGVNAPLARISTPEMLSGGPGGSLQTLLIGATPGIFQTLGVRILAGRGLDERDDAASPGVVVVSAETARRVFGTTAAVGREVNLHTVSAGRDSITTPVTIVGVAADTDTVRLMGSTGNLVYVPLAQRYSSHIVIAARTTGNPSNAVRLLQAALRAADPEIGTIGAGAARTVLAGPYVLARRAAVAAAVLGGLTLLLAMIGLYGVQARMVGERTRELGVRLALGARPDQLARMVVQEGFRPVVEGLALGFFFGTVLRLGVRVLLEAPVQVIDPVAFVAAALPLFIAALCACYLPARRASRVEPAVALQHL